MDWLLKLLGVSAKGRRVAKNISKLSKAGNSQKTKSSKSSPASIQAAQKPSIVDIEDLNYENYIIVGESFYQEALEKHAGPKSEAGADLRCIVLLICESKNKFDKNAVRVDLEGETVGYLTRDDAVLFRKMLKSEGLTGVKVRAHAIVKGGWRNKDGEGNFGIELDFDWDDSEDF